MTATTADRPLTRRSRAAASSVLGMLDAALGLDAEQWREGRRHRAASGRTAASPTATTAGATPRAA